MAKYLKELVRTDLVQAQILNDTEYFDFFKFIYYFFRSRTCRIQTFVRLRSSNPLVAFLSKKYLDRFFIEVGRDTEIGKYFFLPHPRCIIIANRVNIGENVHVGQYVTIGGSFKKSIIHPDNTVQKVPFIGNRVIIAAGTVIGGPVQVGNQVIIAANSVITKDIPDHKIASGQNNLSQRKIEIPKDGGEFKYLN